MKSFIIKEFPSCTINLSFDIKKDGFSYRFKLANDLGVREIIIMHPEIIDSLILANFNKRYRKIWEYYLYSLQEEDGFDSDTSGKLMLALDEITRLRGILIRKYHKNITCQCEEKMLKKLKLLENEIRMKIIDFKIIKEQELAHNNIMQEKSKAR